MVYTQKASSLIGREWFQLTGIFKHFLSKFPDMSDERSSRGLIYGPVQWAVHGPRTSGVYLRQVDSWIQVLAPWWSSHPTQVLRFWGPFGPFSRTFWQSGKNWNLSPPLSRIIRRENYGKTASDVSKASISLKQRLLPVAEDIQGQQPATYTALSSCCRHCNEATQHRRGSQRLVYTTAAAVVQGLFRCRFVTIQFLMCISWTLLPKNIDFCCEWIIDHSVMTKQTKSKLSISLYLMYNFVIKMDS